jgi:hypothetical protein
LPIGVGTIYNMMNGLNSSDDANLKGLHHLVGQKL